MQVQTITNMLNSFDNETLFEFDPFLIGEGSKFLMNDNRQDLSMFDIDEEAQIVCENDLDEFVPKSEQIIVEDLFYEVKKTILERFGYIKRRSEQFSNQLFLEKDLIISPNDHYFIDFLKENSVSDKNTVDSIAQLCAYKELGFLKVKFYKVDDCPICNAFDGNVFVVEDLISSLCSNDHFSHLYASCNFVPVVEDRQMFSDYLNMEVEKVFVGETLVENFPMEYSEELLSILSNLKYKKVKFCDLSKFKDVKEEVVIDTGESLYVNNKYCGDYSPIDFLKIYLNNNEEKIVESVESNSEEVYYLNGKRVKKTNQGFVEV